jgi:flagellar capping protein FliD
MEPYSLDQLTTMINALTGRVNVLDGQNLGYPTVGSVANLVTQINSLTTDLSQLAASFESQLTTYRAALTLLQAQYNTLVGQPNIPPQNG